MGQELGLDGQPGVFPLSDRFAEMGGIPVNDDGGEQAEPGHAVVLALAGAVADFALAPDAEGVLERVMSLALVQAGVGSAEGRRWAGVAATRRMSGQLRSVIRSSRQARHCP